MNEEQMNEGQTSALTKSGSRPSSNCAAQVMAWGQNTVFEMLQWGRSWVRAEVGVCRAQEWRHMIGFNGMNPAISILILSLFIKSGSIEALSH